MAVRNFLINIEVVNQKVSDSHDSLSKDFQNIEHDNTSFFIADSLRATDKLNIHLVARSDEDYEGERATSYSINTNYDVNDKFSIGAGYSHTIQLPTLQDLYRANSRNGNWRGIVGNPKLENEKSNSYEFRICYKANDRWNLNLTGYRYNIDDMVGVKTAGELGLAGQNGWRTGIGRARRLV